MTSKTCYKAMHDKSHQNTQCLQYLLPYSDEHLSISMLDSHHRRRSIASFTGRNVSGRNYLMLEGHRGSGSTSFSTPRNGTGQGAAGCARTPFVRLRRLFVVGFSLR